MNLPANRKNQPYTETYNRISKYYFDKTGTVRLSDDDMRIFERWSFADSMIRLEYVDERNVAGLLQKKFPDIGRSTAYEDIRNAKKLWGTLDLDDQLYFSNIHYSYALQMFKLCRQSGQYVAAERYLKIMHEIKGSHVDSLQDEAMRELAKSVEQSKIVYIITDPGQVGLKKYDEDYINKLKTELFRGVQSSIAVDANYTELPNNDRKQH